MIRKTNLAHRSNYGNKRSTSTIKYIVLHYTANDGDSDENNGKYFNGANRGASAHIFVDDDSCTQSVPDNYVAYSVGGNKYSNTKGGSLYGKATNANTLNIEMCDTVKNGKYEATAKTQENAITIVREKMKQYNIPIDRVIRHYVVDFFYFSLIDFPIFNVADIYVTVSAFGLIILLLFYYKEEDLEQIFHNRKGK